MSNQADPASRAAAVVVHDVAPATQGLCEQLFALTDALADELRTRIPLTLLIVPRFHGDVGFDRYARFRKLIDARLAHGDELALHGFNHRDEGVAPTTPAEWFARRLLTNSEAEFATLTAQEAKERIERGLDLFHSCSWQPMGFVPPAWQASPQVLATLARFHEFRYTSSLRTITCLPDGTEYAVPCLCLSARSAVRRALSIAWNRLQAVRLHRQAWIRVALHPVDAAHDTTLHAWNFLLRRVLQDRAAVTKSVLAQFVTRRARHQRPMSPRREAVS